MVIAVPAVGMVQVTVHQVVHVVSVRHRLMTAARAVDMVRGVGLTIVGGRAVRRVVGVDGQAVLEVGDRLRLGTPGIELQLIAVVGDGDSGVT